MALWKFSTNEIRNRPGRAILTLLSVVLGVAAVVAVTISTNTTRAAYQQMYQAMTGKASLEIVGKGGGDFDEQLLTTVEKVPGVKAAAPFIQRILLMYHGDERARVTIIGIDPKRDEAVRQYVIEQGQFINEGGGIMPASLARSMNIKVGDEVRILSRGGRNEIPIVGLLSARGAAAVGQGGMLFLPLETAQRIVRARGEIDSIHIVVEEGVSEQEMLKRLAAVLPENVEARRPVSRTQLAEETLRASEQGLRLATALSLVVAAFIILNAFLMNVGERRRQLAVLRAIGATRGQIIGTLLREGLAMGIVGTVLGIFGGYFGALYLTRAMGNLFQASLPSFEITPDAVLRGVAFGLGVSLLATFVPARKAGRVSPLEGMRDVATEAIEGVPRWMTWLGIVVFGIGALLLVGCITGWAPVELATWSAVISLGGLVLLIPVVLDPLSRLVSTLLSPMLGIEGSLAYRQILRRRIRTTLTIGVLFVALTAGIGIASTMLDSINDVRKWYNRTLVGDFFIRAMMPDMGTGLAPDLPDELEQEIKQVPGVTSVEGISFVSAKAADLPVLLVVRTFSLEEPLPLDLRSGDPEQVQAALHQGQVVVGTVLAQRANLKAGDEIVVETGKGPQPLRIAGVSNEYMVGGLAMFMQRGEAAKLFDVQGMDAFVVKARPETLAQTEAGLQALENKYGFLLHSFSELTQLIDGMMSGIVGSLWVILALGFVVAAFGVVNTLTMNVLEQTREIGMLRVIAMTRGQIRKTILAQATIMGVIGLAPGIFAGVLMAYLMNLTLLPVIGRTFDFVVHPLLLVSSFAVGLLVILAAAWLPARRAANLKLLDALHYE